MAAVIVHIGVDVGQQRDPTAICVAELGQRPTGRVFHHSDRERHIIFGCTERCIAEMEATYTVRFLERLPLGTPYPAVAARLATLVVNVLARGPDIGAHLYLDATGVGRPVADLVTAQIRDRCRFTPVTFVHGHRCSRDADTNELRLGKAFLVSRLQVLLQSTRVVLPSTDEAQALARELQDYEIRVDDDANDKYGAFKVGTHDDLVTALGLAVAEEPRMNSAVGAFV